MSVRGVLAFVLGLAVAIAVAGYAYFRGGGGQTKAPHQDMVVVIWLDKSCKQAKVGSPAIAYDNYHVTFVIRGECTPPAPDALVFSSDDGLSDDCQNVKKCTAPYPSGDPSKDLTIHITPGIAQGTVFNYKFDGTYIHIDPALEIDP